MQELIKMVSDKAGISEDQARKATETVMGYLKGKLPPAVASQLDGVASGGSTGNLGDIASGLGGKFGA